MNEPVQRPTQPLLSDRESCAALVLWFHLSRRLKCVLGGKGGCDNVNSLRLRFVPLSPKIFQALCSRTLIDHRYFEGKMAGMQPAL